MRTRLLSINSLPDVVGTLVPTITISLIYAIPALRIRENPSTHKDANKPIYSILTFEFCPVGALNISNVKDD